MSRDTVLFFLCLCVLALLCVVLYQRFAFRRGVQADLRAIHNKLKEISDTDSEEKVKVFTENRELMELAAQINRLLEDHLRIKADYRRFEMASRRMLSNISHDMKTPMTVILGYLEIMQMNGATEETLEKTRQKAEKLVELIDQFFTLAKIEAGDKQLEISRIDACEICRESILDFYEILSGADFRVEIGLPESPVYVQGDREALQRILSNLISNGIRYGAHGKYLGIFLGTDKRDVCIEVADKGQGIPESFEKSVFDRLFTMEDSRSRSVQGNGLGLTIARNLARQMGGDISLASIPYERTVFTVRLKKFPC